MPPLITLNTLQELERYFAIRQICTADVKVPIEAIRVLQQQTPREASRLLLAALQENSGKYANPLLPLPSLFRNCLLLLAYFRESEAITPLLSLIEMKDFQAICSRGLSDVVEQAVAALLPGVPQWQEQVNKCADINVQMTLIRALPIIVYREDSSRSDAAGLLLRHFENAPAPSQQQIARSTVLSLFQLMDPASGKQLEQINSSLPSKARITSASIEAAFSEPEVVINATQNLFASWNLQDPAKAFESHVSDGFLDFLTPPETLEDAIELLNGSQDPFSIAAAGRRLLAESDAAAPLLLKFVAHAIDDSARPRNTMFRSPKRDAETPQIGPAHAVLILLEMRSPELLPLLLKGIEARGTKCLECFNEVVAPVLGSIVGMTAESPEFIVQWVRRLGPHQPVVKPLLRGLWNMVLEDRADRQECVQLLRRLFVELSSDTADQSLFMILDATIVTLIQLGDTQVLADLSGDPRLDHESLAGSAALIKGINQIEGGIATCVTAFALEWFMNQRFMSVAYSVEKRTLAEMNEFFASDREDSHQSDAPAAVDADTRSAAATNSVFSIPHARSPTPQKGRLPCESPAFRLM
jgi:hypothetical protein